MMQSNNRNLFFFFLALCIYYLLKLTGNILCENVILIKFCFAHETKYYLTEKSLTQMFPHKNIICKFCFTEKYISN